ncbi:Electron transfer flavoprotein-ubiquinone oxidoreductase [Fundidesulfovibrio magnetotacticus]|uniref:Electron transfer flavoprotein-ubiquinone oxidoreductase n=1 Tax=Fundidesulfovibrio magnetotacticus TaxID=2730080 RepID=A0A6V8M257_9BACT|nr:4Fe-4S ferredoxin [Fundidesulfovibrio magnetotacticus]GFK94535.1 Electron transfer flavoprotein-ubiquinone oxidoreductase [Fundidesulfovibrio magnetotacticus]
MSEMERQSMDVDIVCVGFGPAMGGFLTTLSRGLMNPDGTPAVESAVMPGMPPQVICYERADDIAAGVSGVVSKARGIRETFPDFDPAQVPLCAEVTHEKVAYLLDPHGASRRQDLLDIKDGLIRTFGKHLPFCGEHSVELPWIPPFLRKEPGLVFSLGQFNQWVGAQVMAEGVAQVWPGMPVDKALVEDGRVVGVRLVDQGVTKQGEPDAGYMPGMDIKAALTVIGDGPVGPVGRGLDDAMGMPHGHTRRDWALGMKMVVDLPESCTLPEGFVLHTFGYPEPDIFGFLYVLPGRVASLGIFVPSWLDIPVRTAYRYLQHWITHPYLWQHLKGGVMRSWGAKSLLESGRRGEPWLVGDGYARIGEGSGTTNVLTGSGVDEAWTSGVQLAEGVLELLRAGKPFSRANLKEAYVARRRASHLEAEAKVAEKSRDGFGKGFIQGLMGMALTGFTEGKLNMCGDHRAPHERVPTLEETYYPQIPAAELARMREECRAKGEALHDAVMDRVGWPKIEYDGQLLVSHQDALLLGGKVQAPFGYADHVVFVDPQLCEECGEKICIDMCSGQAITMNPEAGVPLFDREKCVHCGACLWNCSKAHPNDPEKTNVDFRAGAGGLHSAEN